MDTYILTILTFFATIVGIFGHTSNENEKGWKKITVLGYTALFIGLFSFSLTVYNTFQKNKIRELKTEYGSDELRIQLLDLKKLLQNDEKKTDITLNDSLIQSVEKLNEIISTYDDNVPNEIFLKIRYIETVLLNRNRFKMPFKEMIYSLKKEVNQLEKMNNEIYRN